MADKKDKNVAKSPKLTLSEYQKLKASEAKKRLKLNFPWPVMAAILVPLVFFLILLLGYIIYIRNL